MVEKWKTRRNVNATTAVSAIGHIEHHAGAPAAAVKILKFELTSDVVAEAIILLIASRP